MNDEELMSAFQQGDDSAFEQLYTRYQRPIFQYIFRRMADRSRAEELTQEVFMGLIRARGAWRQEATFKTYLYRIAFNQCASEARRADFRSTDPLEHSDGTPMDVVSNRPGPETEANKGEEAALVANAIEQLDPDQREAILLREYQGLSYEEISDITGAALGTVKSRIFRGKLELKRLLEPLMRTTLEGQVEGKILPLRGHSQ